ncbi:synaptophysin-like isoform X2 [Gigantopelta aegis]|uniref:synaptophysin-like isoform X2 n=1 Tax=Gigantopelta aegis TaxID=1735272 RepID=UPI001B88D05A|nr:synaptophysin-like isoform X2 [Gigantopelta aegis]
METAGQVMSAFNPSVLKEPRGFIKPIEWIISIFAFATTTSFSTNVDFTVPCNITKGEVSYTFSYPFDLQNIGFKIPVCPTNVTTSTVHLLQGAESPAQFYVFVGVMAFLYCLVALILYIFFDDLYRKNTKIVAADFIVSVVITALWLISSSAWAQGVSDVKLYTDPQESGLFENKIFPECVQPDACKVTFLGNFAGLNVSIIFGFLNFGVWVGNLWFLYKETPWFKVKSKPPSSPDM